MEQFFNKAWRNQAWWLWLLLPVSWLYRIVTWLNKKAYNIGLKNIYYAPVPVIVIGNITVGGSGKTPLIIALVQYLQTKHIQVGVISRGYGGDSHQMPALVTPQSTPTQVGDEPCLIVQSLQAAEKQATGKQATGKTVPMAVCPNREQAIALLLQHFPNTQLILADDGLQHHALDRDKNWIVVDSDRGFGNRQVLPVGFLREPIKRLSQPDTTVIFHQKDWLKTPPLAKGDFGEFPVSLLMKLEEQPLQPLFPQPFSSTLTPTDCRQVIAMTGIGFPQRFFNSVKSLGFEIIEKPFNDHHHFSLSDFENLPEDLSKNLPIVITAKDAVKIRLLVQESTDEFTLNLKDRIWVLPVVAKLSDSVWYELDRQLLELGID